MYYLIRPRTDRDPPPHTAASVNVRTQIRSNMALSPQIRAYILIRPRTDHDVPRDQRSGERAWAVPDRYTQRTARPNAERIQAQSRYRTFHLPIFSASNWLRSGGPPVFTRA